MNNSSADYYLSTDVARLNLDLVVAALQSTYWAKDRPASVIKDAWSRSLCFGVYSKTSDVQAGFARVVTDGATFSWLCDVFVAPEHRGRGLGKLLVEEAIRHPSTAGTTFHLGTRDAHGLYEKYGFFKTETMKRAPSGFAQKIGVVAIA